MTDTTIPTLDGLTARRKGDRETIAAAYRAIAQRHGATVTQRDEPPHPGYSGASIALSFKLNGVGGSVDVDDLHERCGSAGGLLSWYNDSRQLEPTSDAYPIGRWSPARNFSPAFNSAARDYKGRPHHKATSVGSWAALGDMLDRCLALAASGDAFIAEDES